MPKVRVKSLRRLASICQPSILTGAITESADYIEELETELERYKNAMNLAIGHLEESESIPFALDALKEVAE